jgi:oxygen-independent coproporphyrinogen III oxidase
VVFLRIRIEGLNDERFHRPIRLISNLFFEETEVFLHETDQADISFQFRLIVGEKIQVTVSLNSDTEQEIKATFENIMQQTNTEKEEFIQIKNAVAKAYLMVLQNWTGITQKWGILTGVRPTKLLHKKLVEKTPLEMAQRQLAEGYFISAEKIELMQQIVDRQVVAVPDLYQLKEEVSIYIGIPFCPTKCAYCTFPAYAINNRQGTVDSFLTGLHYEIQQVGQWLKENKINITTVYFGGGTPTSISADQMDLLYEQMYSSFPHVDKIREVTVEAGRPDTISIEKLDILKKWKIDRISINPQTYIQETLNAIGRHHTVEETKNKFLLARKMGMNNINMDLIIGLPGEGLLEFEHTLSEIEKVMPESLTVHTLSFKRASDMTKNKQKYQVAGRHEVDQMMKRAKEWTEEHGYAPYYLYRQKNILGNLENVGYAIPGKESIYNILIMEEMQTIIGLGCGAASKFIHPITGEFTHFANPKDPKTYNESFKEYSAKKLKILDQLFMK